MSVELETLRTIAAHLAELVTAHGLVEAGKAPVRRGAKAAVEWLRTHLPAEAQDDVTTVIHTRGPSRARNTLEAQIGRFLEIHPGLVLQIRALLADARGEANSQHQTVGDNNSGPVIQNRGTGNMFNVA